MQLGKVLCYGLSQGISVIHLSLPEFVILILHSEGCVLNKCGPFILEDDCTKTSVEWRWSWIGVNESHGFIKKIQVSGSRINYAHLSPDIHNWKVNNRARISFAMSSNNYISFPNKLVL